MRPRAARSLVPAREFLTFHNNLPAHSGRYIRGPRPPLIALGLGASAVITFLFTWNDLLIAVTLASSENAQTLPVGLTNFVSQYGVDCGAMAAPGVLMVIPTLIFV